MAAYGLWALCHRSWTRFDQDMTGWFHLAAAPIGAHASDAALIDCVGATDLLMITAISDPDHFPDRQNLVAALRDEFDPLASPALSWLLL